MFINVINVWTVTASYDFEPLSFQKRIGLSQKSRSVGANVDNNNNIKYMNPCATRR